ncbi:MAG: MarR family winged helix-turn-helix transcriptional regulator [Candidatus Thorarchaeota archaeon]
MSEKPIYNGGFVLSQIHHLSKRIFNKILKNQGIEINPGQGRILYTLWKNDELSLQAIAKKTSLSTSSLTGMIDRMEEANLVKRKDHSSDRRKTIICLTDETKEMHKKYLHVSGEINEIMYNGFSENEIKIFEDFLDRIHDNYTSYEKGISDTL